MLFLLNCLLLIWSVVQADYVLIDDYTPESFTRKFDFYDGFNPGHGFANYVNRSVAESEGLYKVENNKVYIGVDHQNKTKKGRNSVKLISKAKYDHGLFIINLDHMPGSVCSSWPAFWLTGPNWPNDGEIDVIEGVNTQKQNRMSLHTSDNCSINKYGEFTGSVLSPNCYGNAPGQSQDQGCSVEGASKNSYGDGFNLAGGGIYALEWTSVSIKIWYFPHSKIPGDILIGRPDPDSWSLPSAKFDGPCNIDKHFRQQQIIINIDFCGGWASGLEWLLECINKAGVCEDFVRNNPNEFKEVYWLVNWLRVYKKNRENRTIIKN